MPNGSTTKFVHAIAAISRAVADVAIRQYLVVASELKIDELRYLRHQHQRDPEEASDGHRPARGRLPSEWGWPTSLRCRIGTLRALVACQLSGVRREPGDRQERGRDKERGSAIDRLQPARAVAPRHRQQYLDGASDILRAEEHPGDDDGDERDRLPQATLERGRHRGATAGEPAQHTPQVIDHEVETMQRAPDDDRPARAMPDAAQHH